ncbi:MAG: TlpA family protein disulfide reductase [Firmicutes bacterium]|nr:TlpA family protein disulfide reductase [Bacillota bacterium]
MKKKILCILTAAAMLLCFASCGASKDETPSDTEDMKTVSFETTDLKGNVVRSEDIFGKYDLTLVNLWGTYCGPCIREMPDLALLDERLKEKNCAVVGVVIDVDSAKDRGMVRTAEGIMEETGVEYLNLVFWSEIYVDFPAEYIPTSYMVDSAGRIVDGPFVGAMGADEYEKLIDDALKEIKKD